MTAALAHDRDTLPADRRASTIDAIIEATLDALLDATPPPPEADVDPADVLDGARRMVEQRRGPYARLRAEVERDRDALVAHPEFAKLLARLRKRDAAWAAAIARAHGALRQRIAAVSTAQTHRRRGASRGREK